MKVRVYRNLHTGTLSLQTYIKGKGWRVKSHPKSIYLLNAVFKVSEAGRQRVLKQRRKNVHAYIYGDWESASSPKVWEDWGEAYYNPYKTHCFIDKLTFEPIHEAPAAIVRPKRISYAK